MLTRREIVASIDLGTSNVRVIVGETITDGTVNIIGVGTSPSEGIKKGVIIDLERTVDSITGALAEAERMVGSKIGLVNVGIVGSHVGLVNNRGVVAVARDDKEITEHDVERVLQAARVIALPQYREIIDVIPREFIVDGYDGIRDPVGMLGVRLEVESMIITGAMTSLRNLLRCLNMAGLEVNALILNSLANGEICLSRDEKELGVFLIDLGGGTTEVALYQQGGLKDLAVLPVGGDHITNDLAVGLRTTFQLAEKLKVEHGFALADLASDKDVIEIEGISGKEKRKISSRELFSYVEPRVQEMIQLCSQEMGRMGFTKMPPAGVVLTGGVSLMGGITELAETVFECPVRIAQPDYLGVKSPIYSTAVGIIHYVNRNHITTGRVSKRQESQGRFFHNIWQRIRTFIMDIWE
ncbi:MAG: cell division protein FtsA [Bacillota bacterium]|nr:cell division protein FtsA [Bacillota bacterium]